MTRIPIELPVLGYDQETGTIAGWLKQIGDRIERGDPVAEIETEKVTAELTAQDSGTLVSIVADVGQEVAVGQPIGWLEDGA